MEAKVFELNGHQMVGLHFRGGYTVMTIEEYQEFLESLSEWDD